MSMTENEIKAIKWIKNVRDDAVITLDHIQKNEPNVSPMLYAGRKQKSETIMEMCEQLEQYRAIGTIDEFKALKEKNVAKKPIRNDLCNCPSCGSFNEVIGKRRNTVAFDTVYCWHCGQEIEIKRD
jgi:hypothetical protein